MSKRRYWIFLLVFLSLFGIGTDALYPVILIDQLNNEARAGRVVPMQALLRQGAGIEGRSIHFKTPLMPAAEAGQMSAGVFL